MKRPGKEFGAVAAAMLVASAVAAPSVEITNVQQQYPWTNTVDITYTVQGVDKTHQTNRLDHIVNATYFSTFEAKNGDSAILDVNGNSVFTNALVEGNGTFVAQWQPTNDLQLTGCTITPSVFRGEENAYLVINLETNAQGKCEWWYEPMSTQDASNKRYGAIEYKTTKLVLRRIPANTYQIGGQKGITSNDVGINTIHNVTMEKDYYMGIYEVTIAQYNRMKDLENPGTSALPVGAVSWSELRGGALSNVEPGEGVIKSLNTKTSLNRIDLPTCAMWEVAARAGVSTYFLWGNSLTGARRNAYAWWNAPSKGKPQVVGTLLPNNWGLYDVHGNHAELTLDLYQSGYDMSQITDGLEPCVVGSYDTIRTKGDSWNHTSGLALHEFQTTSSNLSQPSRGFRLAYYPR